MRSLRRQSLCDPETLELSSDLARPLDLELQQFIKRMPKYFALHAHSMGRQPTADSVSSPMNVDGGRSSTTPFVSSSPFQSSTPVPLGISSSSAPSSDHPTSSSTSLSTNILAVQGCILRATANSLSLKLWSPFLRPSRADDYPNAPAELAAATASQEIINASHHLMDRLKTTNPITMAFYGFGQAVWHAGLILGSIVIHNPDVLYAEKALNGIALAVKLMNDPLVAGFQVKNVQDHQHQATLQSRESHATSILRLIESLADKAFTSVDFSLGSKRKVDRNDAHLRFLSAGGFRVPYVGGCFVTGPLEGDLKEFEGTGGAGAPGASVGLGIRDTPISSADVMMSRKKVSRHVLDRGSATDSGPEPQSPWVSQSNARLPGSHHDPRATEEPHSRSLTKREETRSRPAHDTTSENEDDVSEVTSVHAPSKTVAQYPVIGVRSRPRDGSGRVEAVSSTRLANSQNSQGTSSKEGGSRKSRTDGSNSTKGKKREDSQPANRPPSNQPKSSSGGKSRRQSVNAQSTNTQYHAQTMHHRGPETLPAPPPHPGMQMGNSLGFSGPPQDMRELAATSNPLPIQTHPPYAPMNAVPQNTDYNIYQNAVHQTTLPLPHVPLQLQPQIEHHYQHRPLNPEDHRALPPSVQSHQHMHQQYQQPPPAQTVLNYSSDYPYAPSSAITGGFSSNDTIAQPESGSGLAWQHPYDTFINTDYNQFSSANGGSQHELPLSYGNAAMLNVQDAAPQTMGHVLHNSGSNNAFTGNHPIQQADQSFEMPAQTWNPSPAGNGGHGWPRQSQY